MQTIDQEMSKDPSEALFNPPVSSLSRKLGLKQVRRHEASPSVSPSFLDASSVAEFLGVSRRWVMEHSRSGDLPALKLGKVFRYKMSAIEAWLEGQDAKRQCLPR
jgi:excisionase family DNA binding protein